MQANCCCSFRPQRQRRQCFCCCANAGCARNRGLYNYPSYEYDGPSSMDSSSYSSCEQSGIRCTHQENRRIACVNCYNQRGSSARSNRVDYCCQSCSEGYTDDEDDDYEYDTVADDSYEVHVPRAPCRCAEKRRDTNGKKPETQDKTASVDALRQLGEAEKVDHASQVESVPMSEHNLAPLGVETPPVKDKEVPVSRASLLSQRFENNQMSEEILSELLQSDGISLKNARVSRMSQDDPMLTQLLGVVHSNTAKSKSNEEVPMICSRKLCPIRRMTQEEDIVEVDDEEADNDSEPPHDNSNGSHLMCLKKTCPQYMLHKPPEAAGKQDPEPKQKTCSHCHMTRARDSPAKCLIHGTCEEEELCEQHVCALYQRPVQEDSMIRKEAYQTQAPTLDHAHARHLGPQEDRASRIERLSHDAPDFEAPTRESVDTYLALGRRGSCDYGMLPPVQEASKEESSILYTEMTETDSEVLLGLTNANRKPGTVDMVASSTVGQQFPSSSAEEMTVRRVDVCPVKFIIAPRVMAKRPDMLVKTRFSSSKRCLTHSYPLARRQNSPNRITSSTTEARR